MDISFSVYSSLGDEYRVTLSTFTNLPDTIVEILGNHIELVDVTLERISGSSIANVKILATISNIIAEVFEENENLILYFYCDDVHEIPRRNKNLSPQEYRSLLFSNMIDRYLFSKNITDIINTPIKIEAEQDIFIHIISRKSQDIYVKAIQNEILSLNNK